MPLCVKCNRDVCSPCIRTNDSLSNQLRVYVATDDELRSKFYFRRLAVATAALKIDLDLSRREFPNYMADVIFGYDGKVLWRGGGTFSISDTAIDDAFNNDGSFRWLTNFVQFVENVPAQRPQWQVLPRLRLIDLVFQIERPDTAQHFGR